MKVTTVMYVLGQMPRDFDAATPVEVRDTTVYVADDLAISMETNEQAHKLAEEIRKAFFELTLSSVKKMIPRAYPDKF